MWNTKFWFAVSLQIKQFQFSLKTWKQSREIARAYGEKKSFTARTLVVCALSVLILAVSVPSIMQLSAYRGEAVSALKKIGKGMATGASRWFDHALHAVTAPSEKSKTAGDMPVTSKEPARGGGLKKNAAPGLVSETVPVVDTGSRAFPSVSTKPSSLLDTVQEPKKGPEETGESSIIMNYCILANKADRTLSLLCKTDGGESWKSIERFPILVGRNDGQKISAGDQRTPEGIYFIVGRKETEELNAIYGPLAYMLNYPNEEDRKAGRTGQGIWIHGTREDTTREATRGCVVLNNNDLATLSKYLQLGIGTPVVIVNSIGLTAPEQAMNFRLLRALRERILFEYNTRQAEFTGLLAQWKQAWESRDIEIYSRFYDPERFFGEGMRWEAWREKKQRTFQNYSMINIGLGKISVSEFSESTAVILFMQRYESDVIRVQRPKKLSFFKSEGRWKIFKEETFSRQELVL
jgi:murein L,D-transpeptidase YafK